MIASLYLLLNLFKNYFLIKKDVLIIGGGIAGLSVASLLHLKSKDFLVINELNQNIASSRSAALINPYSAKDKSFDKWYEGYLASAKINYGHIQSITKNELIKDTIIFNYRKNQHAQHSITAKEAEMLQQYFSIDPQSVSSSGPVWQVSNQLLLKLFTQYLSENNYLLREHFDYSFLEIKNNSIVYKDIEAKSVIFCEGVRARNNPLFPQLPFTQNCGDILQLFVPGLPQEYVYDFGVRLVPQGNDLFWCGSNHRWKYDNLQPDTEWRHQTEMLLHQQLKVPFGTVDHFVAERPTTAGQKVIMQVHPQYRHIGILNGLGTKGFSTAPFYAEKLSGLMNL